MEDGPSGDRLHSFEELDVYKLARELRKSIYILANGLPKEERFNLAIQMKRAAISVTNNIAEGIGRYHYQENIQFCRQARGSVAELIDDLNACLDEHYIDETSCGVHKRAAYRLIKVLNGYIASQRRQKM